MISPLEAHIGYWMRSLSNHVSLSFERKLASRDMSVAEWVVLRILFDDDVSPSQLAKQVGMTKGAISKVIDRLEAKGLIKIEPGIQDRRSQTVGLSPEGRSLIPALAQLADQNDAEFFGHLPVERRRELLDLLRELSLHANLITIPTH